MKWSRLISLATIVLGLALATQASANTVHFWGPNYVNDKSMWVGPAKLTVSGFNNDVWIDAACFRADLSVVPPIEWTANVYRGDQVPFPTQDPAIDPQWLPTQEKLQQLAWLYKQFGLNPQTEWTGIQHSIWALFTPGYTTDSNWLTLATAPGGAWTQEDLRNYYVILPTAGPTSLPSGFPYAEIQPFITTPEPASLGLILMGSGLAAVVRRRRRKA